MREKLPNFLARSSWVFSENGHTPFYPRNPWHPLCALNLPEGVMVFSTILFFFFFFNPMSLLRPGLKSMVLKPPHYAILSERIHVAAFSLLAGRCLLAF